MNQKITKQKMTVSHSKNTQYMRTKEEQIQWTIDKWGLKEDMNGALKDGLTELWDIAQKQVNKNIVKPDENENPALSEGGVGSSLTWIEQQESAILKQMREHTEYLFGLTHYDWMYRATGDNKYLEEQKAYIEEHKAKFGYR